MGNGAMRNFERSKQQKVLHTDVAVFLEERRRHSILILKRAPPKITQTTLSFQ